MVSPAKAAAGKQASPASGLVTRETAEPHGDGHLSVQVSPPAPPALRAHRLGGRVLSKSSDCVGTKLLPPGPRD